MKLAARLFVFLPLLGVFLLAPFAHAQSSALNLAADGDGHIMMTDEVVLAVNKMVSLDGQNYVNASSELSSMALPKDELSVVYVKVSVTNLSDFTVTDVYLDHGFYPGGSDIKLEGIRFESGEARFKEKQNRFIIDHISVGHSATFEYSVALNTQGQSLEAAIDTLLLANIDSNLPIYHDSLQYVDIGQVYNSYLTSGSPFDLMGGAGSNSEGQGANGDGVTGADGAGAGNGNGAGAGGSNTSSDPSAGAGVTPPFLAASGMQLSGLFYVLFALLTFSGFNFFRKFSN